MSEYVKTVGELIAALSTLEPTMLVAVPLHSDYSAGMELAVMELRDNGGYLSAAYRPGTRETKTYAVPLPT